MDSHYDCCVIGTGAAGGILAHRLAKAGLRTISLEQGARIPSAYFAKFYPPGKKQHFGIQKKMQFPPNPDDALFIHDLFASNDIRSSNLASEKIFKHFQVIALDGLQNLWNGVSVRFSPANFANWPIKYEDLAHHYTAVERSIIVCGTQEYIDDVPDGIYIPPKTLRPADKIIIDAVNSLRLPDTYIIPNRKAVETRPTMPNHCINTGLCTFGCSVDAMYKFSTRLLPDIEHLANYTLQLNAKVTRLIRDKASNRIQSVEVLDTQTHEKFHVTADCFILAAGAIESPRILFNSKDEVFTEGLANNNHTLGQYLQDNPKVLLSTSLMKLWWTKQKAEIGYGDLLLLLSKASLADGREFSFIGHSVYTIPDIPYYLTEFRWVPKRFKSQLINILYNSFITLGLFCEGDFVRENKLVPSADVDKYGIPQVSIHFNSTKDAELKMDKMLVFGRSVLRRATASAISTARDYSGTGIHYAGTCRMHADPNLGIVDGNLSCYDHPNLFICDGSVIPYLPDKHLTLTIMALADRLSHHIINTCQKNRTK